MLNNHHVASGYHIGQIQHLRPGLQEQSHAAIWWLHHQIAAQAPTLDQVLQGTKEKLLFPTLGCPQPSVTEKVAERTKIQRPPWDFEKLRMILNQRGVKALETRSHFTDVEIKGNDQLGVM